MIGLNPDRTPVTILTGFLGSGKTTLLNRILQADHGLRVAVLVNDFGEINVDAGLVVNVEGESMELSNGCICCTIRDDLLMAVLNMMQRPQPPEYVIIEASGVSEPAAIALTFLMPELRPILQLDGVITVVDVEQVLDLGQYADLIYDQVYAADIVMLNKVDLVDRETVEQIKDWVRGIVPKARLLETVYADAPLELLLGVGRFAVDPELDSITPHAKSDFMHDDDDHNHDHDEEHEHHHHAHKHDHSQMFSTCSYVTDKPLALDRFRETFKALPTTIFRAKGFVNLADLPDRRAVFQMTGRRASLTVDKTWDGTRPMTKLVFISEPGGLDRDELRAAFDACIADGSPRQMDAINQEWARAAQRQ
jgi:G3E family GTPase